MLFGDPETIVNFWCWILWDYWSQTSRYCFSLEVTNHKTICTYSLTLKYIRTKSRLNSAKSVSNFLVFPDLPKAAKIDIKYQSCLNKMDNQNITLVSLYRSVKGRNKNYFKEMFVVFVRCRRGRNSLGKSLLIANN